MLAAGGAVGLHVYECCAGEVSIPLWPRFAVRVAASNSFEGQIGLACEPIGLWNFCI